jgi:transposase
VQHIEELKRQGLSIQAIGELTGYDRKTVRRYLISPDGVPGYGPREGSPGKLDAFKPYLNERMQAGVWNAQVLLRELRERGYRGGYTILTDWLRPQRESAHVVAVRRFETPPGKHYGEFSVMVRARRKSAFGAGAATHVPLLALHNALTETRATRSGPSVEPPLPA